MRIVILSDSLGRPRPDLADEEKTRITDVYGSILAEKLGKPFIVDLCYVESIDTEDALLWSQRMVAFREPDIIIYHLGINDCTPRVFRKNANPFIFYPLFRKLTGDICLKAISRYRYYLTRALRRTHVPLADYKTNLQKMRAEVIKYSPHCSFFAISIAKASQKIAVRNYELNENIEKYNNALCELFGDRYIDVNLMLPNDQLLISDGVHLTKIAHRLLADELADRIGKAINTPHNGEK